MQAKWTLDSARGRKPARVLRAIGAFPEDQIEAVAKAIYTSGSYFDSKYHITLACFGKFPNQEIKRDFPLVPQILWNDVLAFIYNRFKKYRYQKISHGQWSREGQNLWECSSSSKRFTDFESSITITGG